jgi:hypothetical protein
MGMGMAASLYTNFATLFVLIILDPNSGEKMNSHIGFFFSFLITRISGANLTCYYADV